MEGIVKKSCSMIGFAKRAGKLVCGNDAVRRGLDDGSLRMVFLAKDVSEKTADNIRFFCEQRELPAISAPFMMDDVAHMIGRRVGILGITDPNMEERLKELSEQPQETEE